MNIKLVSKMIGLMIKQKGVLLAGIVSLLPSAYMQGQQPPYYLGHSCEQVMASGRDILGEAMLRDGEPDFEQVATVLPPLHKKTYSFVSGAISWGGVIVDDAGNIYPRYPGRDLLFSPATVDSVLAAVAPQQRWMDGRKPLLLLNYAQGSRSMELLYFVDAGDPDRDPLVWIRARVNSGTQTTEKYLMASASRGYRVKETNAQTFEDTYQTTVAYWDDFLSRTASFTIPNDRLATVAQGAMTAMATTFAGDHPHYGHTSYSLEANDNFPPNYIWSIEACCLTGRFDLARRYLDHMFCYGVDGRGRFNYRQGDLEMRSSSAVEYSQLLFLMNRYASVLKLDEWLTPHLSKVRGMGEEMLRYLTATPQTDQLKLIRMCAEADTNGREYVYMNNNLWAVRGLRALADLLNLLGDRNRSTVYRTQADELQTNVQKILKSRTVETPYGGIVPFRLGYTATPLTLSTCDGLLTSLSQAERDTYKQITWVRDTNEREQDLTENTYANYRYYLEMLSSMLLDDEQASSLVKMREALGGELLGMTRLWNRIDDWPVTNYARFLLESGRIDKYLLLLYAHTLFHGIPDRLCYFEQVSADGARFAADCVPSLLTTPIMLSWLFACEPVNSRQVDLLRAVPKAWFADGFSARGLGCSAGKLDLDVTVDNTSITVSGKLDGSGSTLPFVLYTRFRGNLSKGDILKGGDKVARILSDRIELKPNTREFSIRIRK
ncbi:MAG: hypothetical protein LBD27_08110 [Tannerella sp.]|jgi:hypothetical protein|nr:hypothetical protein [Tannerella sp.]